MSHDRLADLPTRCRLTCCAGEIAARPPLPGDADAQTLLLARFGRRA